MKNSISTQLKQDIGMWMASRGRTATKDRGRAVEPPTIFSDSWKTKKEVKLRQKWCRRHLTKAEAVDLEFHLDELGYDVIKVTPTTKKHRRANSYYAGFAVQVKV
jgi:hypothetical protein